jgi:phosphoribosylformimino-5-aminoimidazole carboxamide ribotide isomerase
MFEVFGVLDLRNGLAVRARGGQRDRYVPIEVVAGEPIPRGSAVALAELYITRFGLSKLYVADLDAIDHKVPQPEALDSIVRSGASVWLDSGVASVEDAERAVETGAERLIVGLETLPTFEVLESMCQTAGPRVVFSLDLRDGTPVSTARDWGRHRPEALARRAVTAGVTGVIVLDLARVGSGSGLDFGMLSRIRRRVPSVPVYAGGGVRSIADIEQLQRVGCEGALVASALLDGQLTERDLNLHLRGAYT